MPQLKIEPHEYSPGHVDVAIVVRGVVHTRVVLTPDQARWVAEELRHMADEAQLIEPSPAQLASDEQIDELRRSFFRLPPIDGDDRI